MGTHKLLRRYFVGLLSFSVHTPCRIPTLSRQSLILTICIFSSHLTRASFTSSDVLCYSLLQDFDKCCPPFPPLGILHLHSSLSLRKRCNRFTAKEGRRNRQKCPRPKVRGGGTTMKILRERRLCRVPKSKRARADGEHAGREPEQQCELRPACHTHDLNVFPQVTFPRSKGRKGLEASFTFRPYHPPVV